MLIYLQAERATVMLAVFCIYAVDFAINAGSLDFTSAHLDEYVIDS